MSYNQNELLRMKTKKIKITEKTTTEEFETF